MPQPQPWVERFALLADLEVQLRAGAAAAVSGLRDGLTGGDVLADGLVEPGVVAVEAHVAAAVVDDDEEPESRQPIRVDHPALGHRAHWCVTLRREEISLPPEAARAHLAVACDDAASHRPRELAAHLGKRGVAQILRRKACGCPAQLRKQRL